MGNEQAKTYYGTVTLGDQPNSKNLGWDPTKIDKTQPGGWRPSIFYCDTGYYLIGLTLFSNDQGFWGAQIMCSKLIRSPPLIQSPQK
jgi:hypothetical protein